MDEKKRERVARCVATRDGCNLIVMYNETTPLAFLEEMRLYSPRVQLGFFKETSPTKAIMYSRFLPFDDEERSGWVFTIDPQEDIAKMNNFRTLIEYAMRHTDNLHLASLYWTKRCTLHLSQAETAPRRGRWGGRVSSPPGSRCAQDGRPHKDLHGNVRV